MAPFAIERRWRDRFLAGGRFGLFVVLFFGLLKLADSPFLPWGKSYRGFVAQALSGNLKVFVMVVFITLLLARMERRSFWAFGLGMIRRGRPLVLGLASGALALTLLLLMMRCGGVVFSGGPATTGIPALENGLAYAALFLTVALAEETLWRGYALVNLAKAISFWPALIVLSALFGLSHAHHNAENHAGILSAAVFSAVLGYSFLRFGSLWFAIGIHTAWDFCQSFLYGVPDSGVVVPGSLMKLKLSGPVWLSGGSAGPEGSYLMVLVFAALILVIRQRGASPPNRAAGA